MDKTPTTLVDGDGWLNIDFAGAPVTSWLTPDDVTLILKAAADSLPLTDNLTA